MVLFGRAWINQKQFDLSHYCAIPAQKQRHFLHYRLEEEKHCQSTEKKQQESENFSSCLGSLAK
jgi:hypothetical protein